MSRFYIPKEFVKGNKIIVSGKEAHHILDVMRLKKLDKIVTFDGTGKEYEGLIKDVRARILEIGILKTKDASLDKRGIEITLIQALPKKDKMDYIVEKATELGVSSIIPVTTARSVPIWDESKKSAHLERWHRLAKEASKQCGRVKIPKIDVAKPFKDLIKDLKGYDIGLIAALSEGSIQIKKALENFNGKKIAVAIGPEGDFTKEEVELVRNAGFKLITLGSNVLKSDTAGLAVLAILNYEYSE